MKPLLVILVTYLAINPGMAALRIGMGFLLHWILPAVDLGISILIGVVVTGLSIHFFIRLLIALEAFDITDSSLANETVASTNTWKNRLWPSVLSLWSGCSQ
jgi:hypothetical protein